MQTINTYSYQPDRIKSTIEDIRDDIAKVKEVTTLNYTLPIQHFPIEKPYYNKQPH